MSEPPRKLEFWYEFASTYSYLSAMRISELARASGVAVVWRPFLLGPIFHAQGWNTSPFNLYPAKGRNMARDMERQCAERGLTFALPKVFPQNSLAAARVAMIGSDEGWIEPYTRAVYQAEFAEGADISDRGALSTILGGLKLDAERILTAIEQPACKQRLKAQTEEAQRLGIYGAPSFVVSGELFWGDDRLQQAIAWANRA